MLSTIASAQAETTKNTMVQCRHFLNYAATHQNAIIIYEKSGTVRIVHSDTSYLSKHKARSCAGGHFFMSTDTANRKDNSAILNLAQLIRTIVSSTTKAELSALYINACKAIPQQNTLEEMGHKQPPTPMQTNNSIALGNMNNNIQPQ
jgi:hypothetical protein